MAAKKIDKEYLLTDSSVNVYGFRLLTSGYQLSEYQKNPIGYHMHKREEGVVVRWEDLTVKGDAVYGKPVINTSHPRAQQTIEEIESGFLNAASVGHIVVLEWTDDPAFKLPGQTGITVLKWYNRETSLVDIPGNCNALTELYDSNDNRINLADLTSSNIPNMKQIMLSVALMAALKLDNNTDQNGFEQAIADLKAKADKADSLQSQLDTTKQQLADLKATQDKVTVESLLAQALTDRKVTQQLSDKLKVQYASNPDGLKDLLAAMPVYAPITTQLGDANDAKSKALFAKSYDELDKSGELEQLKANHFDVFQEKFKEKWGREYTA